MRHRILLLIVVAIALVMAIALTGPAFADGYVVGDTDELAIGQIITKEPPPPPPI